MFFAAHLLLVLSMHAATLNRTPWILSYHCDSGWSELMEEACGFSDYADRERSFPSKQEAIDWINANYMFAPTSLRHGATVLPCKFNYINAASEDAWPAHQKEVDCDTKEKLAGRFDDDTGDSSD
jgi:hypothetical protein